jgi:hypothetical protein
MSSIEQMRWVLGALLIAMGTSASAAQARVPLYDSISLNIGLNCQWQRNCMVAQQRAMKRALAYVKSRRPAAARIHLCNRNARRARNRVDWVGFDNCIRNAWLRTPQRSSRARYAGH